MPPCDPCGIDGGTGVELLFDAVVEPDVDEDELGDESQDPDGGGLGLDWEDDWFDDFEEGDELDEDLFEDAAPVARRRLRLLDVDRRRGGDATLLLRVPRAGRLSAAITRPGDRLTGAGPFLTILTGDMRVKRAGRVRLRVNSTAPGARLLARRRSGAHEGGRLAAPAEGIAEGADALRQAVAACVRLSRPPAQLSARCAVWQRGFASRC